MSSIIIILECNLVIKGLHSLMFINYIGQGFNSSGPTCFEEREGHNLLSHPAPALKRGELVGTSQLFQKSGMNIQISFYDAITRITRELPPGFYPPESCWETIFFS